ncbi:hypothetical protein LCM08_00520 [Salipiger pacificus]|nr:hypothetical protein [Alloyangia pacifica]
MADFNVAQIFGNAQNLMAQKNALDQQRSALERQNKLADFYKNSGAALVQGDQNALAQFAQIDPMAAYDMQRQRAADTRAQESHQLSSQWTRSRIDEIKTQSQRQAEEWAWKVDDRQKQEALTKLEGAYAGAREAYLGGEEPFMNWVGENADMLRSGGIDPATINRENAPGLLAHGVGMIAGLKQGMEYGDSLSGRSGNQGSEAQQELGRLVSVGIPYDMAVKIKEGVYKTVTDPLTRETVVVDLSTGRPVQVLSGDQRGASAGQPGAQEMAQPGNVGQGSVPNAAPAGAPPAPTQPSVAGQTPRLSYGAQVPETRDDRGAFGVSGFAQGLANKGADIVGAQLPFPEVQEGTSDFAVLREQLMNDISQGYARQPPSWLLQEIRKLTPEAGNPLQGAQEADSKLSALERALTREAQIAEGQLSRRMSPASREEAERALSGHLSALERIRMARERLNPRQDNGIRPDVAERLRAYQ